MTNDLKNQNEKHDEHAEIRRQVMETYQMYRRKIMAMFCDAPLAALCVDDIIIKKLDRVGIRRIDQCIDRDFTKIEGLSGDEIHQLTTRLQQFISMG